MGTTALDRLDANATPCDAFWALYKTRLEEAKWWGRAALAVGLATAAAVVAFIIIVALGNNVGSALTALTAVVNGGASVFLFNRRNAVQTSALELLGKVREFCSDEQQRSMGVPA